MKRYRGSYIVEAHPSDISRIKVEQAQRMHLLGILAVNGSELLSYNKAAKIYGANRIDYMIHRELIRGIKDPSSRNGQIKYLRADIDAVIFSNYHEDIRELLKLATSKSIII